MRRKTEVTVFFNGHDLLDYVYGITDIRRDILPPRDLKVVEDSGMDGALVFGARRGARVVEVDVQIKATSFAILRDRIDALATILDTDNVEDLIITDEGGKIRRAILANETELEEIVHTGKATLQFFQPKPYRYGGSEVTRRLTVPYTWESIQHLTWEDLISEYENS